MVERDSFQEDIFGAFLCIHNRPYLACCSPLGSTRTSFLPIDLANLVKSLFGQTFVSGYLNFNHKHPARLMVSQGFLVAPQYLISLYLVPVARKDTFQHRDLCLDRQRILK